MTEATRADVAGEAAQLRARSRALIERSRVLCRESATARGRASELARRYQVTTAAIADSSDLLLDALATTITNLRSLARGSDARLVLLDQLGNLVMRLQLADLGVDEGDARALLQAVGLDQPLRTVPSVES